MEEVFIFCIKVDIDELLMLNKNKGLGVNSLRVISLYILEKVFWFLLLVLVNTSRNLFIFCINLDIDKMLLLYKNKDLGINSFRVISLCNS